MGKGSRHSWHFFAFVALIFRSCPWTDLSTQRQSEIWLAKRQVILRRLREPVVVYSVLCAVGLMLVGAFFLDKSHATHRWIRFGPVGIQPSEIAKLAIILYLAWFLDLKRRNASKMEFRKEDFLQNILPAIGPILVFVALILAQPDLGTSVDILLIAAAVFTLVVVVPMASPGLIMQKSQRVV